MCLDRLAYEDPPTEGEYFKVFDLDEDENGQPCLAFEFHNPPGGLKRGVWIKADRSFQLKTKLGEVYWSGFHGFVAEPDAYAWVNAWVNQPTRGESPAQVVIKCKYRGGRLLGYQLGMPIIVAAEIFIPETSTKE